MGYNPAPIPSFGGGLNARDKEDAVDPSQAIDLMNVEFSTTGAVGQRAGYTNLTSSALTNTVGSLEPFYTTSGTAQLIAGCGTRLEAISTAGAVVASQTGLTSGTWDFARFGAPNNERMYCGQGSQTLQRWDGAAWAAVANTPQAGALAPMTTSNRLAAGRFNGTAGGPTGGAGTSSPSHVYFSNAGDPETWGTNNFIQISPGDGEKVQAVVTWREFTFIFKESKIAVVYGESVDGSGNPVFNFRMIDSGIGLASPRAVAVAPEGIYFLDRRGIYFTNGRDPVLISDLIRPIFQGNASVFYLGGALAQANITNCAATYWQNRLYFAFPTSTTNNRVLVYDTIGKWWSLYDWTAACPATFRVSSDTELVWGRASGSNHIDRHNLSQTADAGTAISSRWRSGWFDLGLQSRKTIREIKAWGTGKVFQSVASNFNQAVGTQTLLDFTPPNVDLWNVEHWNVNKWADGSTLGLVPQLDRSSKRGEVFSVSFANSTLNQSWSIHRHQVHLRGPRRRPTPTNT